MMSGVAGSFAAIWWEVCVLHLRLYAMLVLVGRQDDKMCQLEALLLQHRLPACDRQLCNLYRCVRWLITCTEMYAHTAPHRLHVALLHLCSVPVLCSGEQLNSV